MFACVVGGRVQATQEPHRPLGSYRTNETLTAYTLITARRRIASGIAYLPTLTEHRVTQ